MLSMFSFYTRSSAQPSRVRGAAAWGRHFHHFHHGHHHPKGLTAHLHERYQEKKQQHLNAAARDHGTILSHQENPIDIISAELAATNGLIDRLPESVYGLGTSNPYHVFTNNELDLSDVEVYGFDYDYTLANYRHELGAAIYDILKSILVEMFRYPIAIKDFQYDPAFAIRGLHYDYNNGWLMKIDYMGNIQLNTVHVGREPIPCPDDVIDQHHGLHISPEYLNENMFQLNDIFSLPQACILSDVQQYFKDNNMSFHPRYLSDDVNLAARVLHIGSNESGGLNFGGMLHDAINREISKFLDPSPRLVTFLEKLRRQGKKTFLMTNSSLPFIDVGMKFLTSCNDWQDLFDVVIVSSRKPDFYRSRRPFRRTTEPTWGKVDVLQPGEVYQGGNLNDFSRLTGWSGQKVLYFGDHIFSDLIDPTVQQGWRTGAIIHELQQEINIRNTVSYRHTLSWLIRLEQLLNEAQSHDTASRPPELQHLIDQWRHERMLLRLELKIVFNRHFGSAFRTNNHPTMFAQKVRKFADIYTSEVCNMTTVPRDFAFFPHRTYLPHESVVESVVDTGRTIIPFK